MIKAEIGKYYADENSIIRVDELDHCNEPLGVLILSNETNVSIDHFVDIHYMFYEENALKEITKEEFESKLIEFQVKSNELFNKLRNTDSIKENPSHIEKGLVKILNKAIDQASIQI